MVNGQQGLSAQDAMSLRRKIYRTCKLLKNLILSILDDAATESTKP